MPTTAEETSAQSPKKQEIREKDLSGGIVQDDRYHFSDGNVRVLANKRTIFCVHRFMLEDFLGIQAKLNPSQEIIELPDEPHDLRNTFLIIYSFPPKPLIFSVKELVSALRIASKYNHPTLREFVIHKLELQGLPSLEYLPVARECKVRKWEKVVLDQLAARADPITLAEAEILGMDLFVSLATRREVNPPQARPKKQSRVKVPAWRQDSVTASSASGTKRRLISNREEDHSDTTMGF